MSANDIFIQRYNEETNPETKSILRELLENLGIDTIQLDADAMDSDPEIEELKFEREIDVQIAYEDYMENVKTFLENQQSSLEDLEESFDALNESFEILLEQLGEETFMYDNPTNPKQKIFLSTEELERRQNQVIYAYIQGDMKQEGSDHAWITNQYGPSDSIDNIRMTTKNFQVVANKGKAGKYLAYNHTTSYDFTRYQIYRPDQETKDNAVLEHCFVNSLMQYKIPNEITDQFRQLIGYNNFNVNNIKKLAIKTNIHITITAYDDDCSKPKKTFYGNDNLTAYHAKMILFRAHYMPDIPFPLPDDIPEGCPIFKRSSKKEPTRQLVTIIRNLIKSNSFIRSAYCVRRGIELTDTELLQGDISKDQKLFDSINKPAKTPKNPKTRHVYFSDFESVVRGVPHHQPYKVGVASKFGYESFTSNDLDDGNKIFSQMLESIISNHSNTPPDQLDLVIYFHNLKYDWTLIKQCNRIHVKNVVEKDGSLFSVSIGYTRFTKKEDGTNIKTSYKITLRDSYKMISLPLGSFKKNFGLSVGKMEEFDLYELFTPDNFYNNAIQIKYLQAYYASKLLIPLESDLSKLTPKKAESYHKELTAKNEALTKKHNASIELFRNNGYITQDEYLGELFHHNKLYDDYLRLDCETLMEGMEAFDKIIIGLTNTSVYDYLTISSLAHRYLISQGCYEGTAKVSGRLQEFLAKFAVGGRVMTLNNKKVHVNTGKHLEDFDGVSLYPSAMSKTRFIKGFCEVIPPGLSLSEINSRYAEYFLDASIKVKRRLNFPTVSKITDGVREWTNDLTSAYLDRTGLEDVMNFHEADFLGYSAGVGFPHANGYNDQVQITIKHLFDRRIEAKNAGLEGLSLVLKLMMNSSYGKTLMRDSDKSNFYISAKRLPAYIISNHNKIISMEPLNAAEKYYVVNIRNKDIGNYNSVHLGAAILSMSKRIMNEVMTTAQDVGASIFYTDTDSIHIFQADIPKLSEQFTKTYDRKLIGSYLGQFHTDFDSSKISTKGLCSKEFIALGKKVYIDLLVNDDKQQDHHIRFKGANANNITDYCFRNQITPIKLYKQLYAGKKVSLDLCAGKARFTYKNNNVFTHRHFIKNFQFV